jgi:hypothetical protein
MEDGRQHFYVGGVSKYNYNGLNDVGTLKLNVMIGNEK